MRVKPSRFSSAGVRDFFSGKDGATAIEYALIAGGIALAIIAAVSALGVTVAAKYDLVEGGFN